MSPGERYTTRNQVSAGGVAFRENEGRTEVALISVGPTSRWQLPKGLVNAGEEPEVTARREVREEAGIETELLGELEKIEYWYFSKAKSRRVRFRKFVYFYLLKYLRGDVEMHDHEVNEARWFEISDAIEKLAFTNEKNVVRKAYEQIQQLRSSSQT